MVLAIVVLLRRREAVSSKESFPQIGFTLQKEYIPD
jgi:hypothetical protein